MEEISLGKKEFILPVEGIGSVEISIELTGMNTDPPRVVLTHGNGLPLANVVVGRGMFGRRASCNKSG